MNIEVYVKSQAFPGSQKGTYGYRIVREGQILDEHVEECDGHVVYHYRNTCHDNPSSFSLTPYKEQYELISVAINESLEYLDYQTDCTITFYTDVPFVVNRCQELFMNGHFRYGEVDCTLQGNLRPAMISAEKVSEEENYNLHSLNNKCKKALWNLR